MERGKMKHTRTLRTELRQTRDEQTGQKVIEGYFAVFNSVTELFQDCYEEIDVHAFDDTLNNDIRCLIDHETRLVLGRNKSGTLQLSVDEKGLFGRVYINDNDTDATNLYARVERGDVDQCSFGFNILDEVVEHSPNGSVKWIIRKVDLHEVSVVTFPAYKDTGVDARKSEYSQMIKRHLETKKYQLKEKIKQC